MPGQSQRLSSSVFCSFVRASAPKYPSSRQLGLKSDKMVKWIAAFEVVDDYVALGAGEGDHNEDHKFYGYRAPV